MGRKTFLLIFILAGMLVVSACGQGSAINGASSGNSSSSYDDDQMIGHVWTVDQTENIIEVDISEWAKRDSNSDTDEGYSYFADFSKETAITYEDGTIASVEDLKNGQKLLVNPPMKGDDYKGHADEIVLLDMTYEEKYRKLLSHREGYNIVVMYENEMLPPEQSYETLFMEANSILQGTDHQVWASGIEYDPNYVVDYKAELNIEQFPVYLIFNETEFLLKSYTVDEIYSYFEDLKK